MKRLVFLANENTFDCMQVTPCVYICSIVFGVYIYVPVADYRADHEGLRNEIVDNEADPGFRHFFRDDPRKR